MVPGTGSQSELEGAGDLVVSMGATAAAAARPRDDSI
jgi:hypothetical protein